MSKGNVRRRLETHVNGNASQSTIQATLGVLVTAPLGLTLTMYNERAHYGDEETLITQWMYEHARVAYVIDPAPWDAEDELLKQRRWR